MSRERNKICLRTEDLRARGLTDILTRRESRALHSIKGAVGSSDKEFHMDKEEIIWELGLTGLNKSACQISIVFP
jgi:hypothetical protein